MSVRRVALAVLVLALAVGCGSGAATQAGAPETVHARLGGGTAALVGTSAIPVSLVVDVARAQRASPRAALDDLIADALAAEGARATGDDRSPLNTWTLDSIIARSTAEHARVAAHAAGPPTDAEVAQLSVRYWRDVDLPEQAKVIHAVVRRPKDPSQYDAARALAAQLATSLAGAKSDDDFDARARAFPHGVFDVTVERLSSFVADGRIAEGDPGIFDPAFARGAFALKKPGDTSGAVESTFGWHVIRLIERRPPKMVPLEERRVRFASEVYAIRGHDALGAVLSARRAGTPIYIQPDAEALMATVQPSPAP
jgi:hypothetical protein